MGSIVTMEGRRRVVAKRGKDLEPDEVYQKAYEKAVGDALQRVISNAFKGERNFQGLTQDEVADRSRLPRYTVNDVENSRSRDVLTLWQVAEGLGVTLAVLLARADREWAERKADAEAEARDIAEQEKAKREAELASDAS